MKLIKPLLLAAVLTVPALTACKKEDAAKTEQAAAPVVGSAPTTEDDTAWGNYLTSVVRANMEGVEGTPFVYYLPGPSSADYAGAKDRLLTQVQNDVARGVLPGNMLAFASPDSKAAADMAADALGYAEPNSMRGVTVLFVGKPADQGAVKAAADKAGATFKVIETK
jgi:hypothetical protein